LQFCDLRFGLAIGPWFVRGNAYIAGQNRQQYEFARGNTYIAGQTGNNMSFVR